jgi:hypothetical protein
LAVAVGTPAVVLFSGTNRVEQWRPWGRRIVVLRHDVACSPCHRQTCPWMEHPCMSGLTAQSVSRAIRQLRFEVRSVPAASQGDAEQAVEQPAKLASLDMIELSSSPMARKSA